MIDENQPRIPCWLVWSTATSGLVTLEAISLTPKHAEYARRILLDERGEQLIGVKIEKAECNHMFSADLDEVWWKLYGEQASARTENSRVEALQKELDTARGLGNAMFRSIGMNDPQFMRQAASMWKVWDRQ